MAQRVGPLSAEISNAESEKYTAPLVLVHGLWERAAAWRRFTGYLGHRGWHCIAVERRGDVADVARHVADLRAAIAALDAPPVVLGHDLGANLALACRDVARATVALAPLVGPPYGAAAAALQRAGSWLSRRRGAPLRPPGGRWAAAYPRRDSLEAAALVRQVIDGVAVPAAVGSPAPCVVVAMEEDVVTPLAASQALAEHTGCELLRVPGGHAALSEPGWENGVAAIHRWIVQRLGVDLLAFYEEAMNPE